MQTSLTASARLRNVLSMPSAHVTVLHFIRGKYQGQEFPLDKEAFIAGRSSEADLILADDAVSRKHARFYARRGRHWVRDLGSRNGTLINGDQVEKHCLRSGDRLAIGASLARIEFREPGAVSSRRAGEVRKDSTAHSMSGSLEDIPLMDVLQWLATSRKTGALKVKDPGTRVGALHLRDGRVFYAEIEGNAHLHPEKALLRMLSWDRGMFQLDSDVLDQADVELEVSLEHMLMEAARQQDELADLGKKTPLPSRGDEVTLVKPSPVRWKELDSDEIDLVQAVVETGGWWEALDASDQDDLTMYRRLAALAKKGVFEY